MDRNREARRASIVGSNGFNRRRHRTNSLRDSPEKDGGVELQESVRLRDRVKKKDRDRDRERERDRERDSRERERERYLRDRSNRSKRRRAEGLANNKDDIGGDETSEESVNEDEDEEDEESAAAAVRFSSSAMGSISNHHVHVSNHHHSHISSFTQQQHNSISTSNIVGSHNHHLLHRKTFPPSSSSAAVKALRAPPFWESGDEMISVSVPRKARSASKRSHDWISSYSNNNNGGGDQNPSKPSSSPVIQSHVSTSSTAPPPPAPPMSPSSSNVSIRKKLKHIVNNTTGAKLKPPKVSSSSKLSSSNPEELEIEIAEVLYGLMTQSQGPSSSVDRLNIDAKSFSSSPVSNFSPNNNPISGPNSSPLSVVAPKRKRPRQVPETLTIPISAKPDTDQTPRCEISSPNVEKVSGSEAENGCEVGGNPVISQGWPREPPLPELIKSYSEINPGVEEIPETRDLALKEDVSSSKELESPVVRAQDINSRDTPSIAIASSATAPANLMVSEIENQKEKQFEIDLMATPPLVRSSHIRESEVDLTTSVVDHKTVLLILDADLKPVVESKGHEAVKGKTGSGKDNSSNVADVERKCEESELNKATENKAIDINLCPDLEKPERDFSSSINANENILHLQTQKQQHPQVPLKSSKEEHPSDKSGHPTSSLLLPMPMASWPGGLPPMGYMTPIQGVLSMEGGSVTPAHIHTSFSQPRPRRCSMHCHIATNIHCLQQLMKMNPFWPLPAGTPSSLLGSKPGNLNVVPPADLNMSVRVVNSAQDKGQSRASNPSSGGKEKSAQPATSSDSAPRKQHQILIQQALPSVAPSNLLGPTFIFPSNHQQQAAMAARLGHVRPPTTTTATTTSSNTTSILSSTTSSFTPTPVSFNYPNMSPKETQYLAILQNSGYPFPIPTVGAPPPNYRGPPAQAMPLLNGSFYSPGIIHQLQHSQQQLSNQQPQLMQAHQNATTSNNSFSPQKQHVHSHQQQRPPQSCGNACLQKNFASQNAQQSHSNHYNMRSSEDSPLTADNRGSRTSMSIYGQNFALPIHPQNLALMTPSLAANGNQNEKKSHQTQQQNQELKTGVDPLPPHIFATSFGPIDRTSTGPLGIDVSSMAQNHAAFQNCAEVRRNIQMMAVSAQASQKNSRTSEGKTGSVESSSKEDERKNFSFTRLDSDAPVTSSVQANTVIESSARSLTVGLGPTRTSRPGTTSGMMGTTNVVPNAQVQAQLQQQEMLQLKYQQQHMSANAVNRNKPPITSDASIYSEHLNSAQMVGPAPKFQSTVSFPQNLIQSNNSSTSPSQSPQWKSSTKTPPASQGPSSLGPSTATMQKNISQHHPRTQHKQISFGGNQNQQSATAQGQQVLPSSNNQVGSPTTSVSKGSSGSPKTTSSASTISKMGHASSFSAQPPKNGITMPAQKSPSILGNPHAGRTPAQQMSQPKTVQQGQLFFSSPYNTQSQSHSMSTSSTNVGPGGYYMQQRRPDQHQRGMGGPPLTSSSGVLTLCTPVSTSNTSTNDPATAIAAATCSVKGGSLQSQDVVHASPFGGQSMGMILPAEFSYVHPVQAGVEAKPSEQKQPAGNDNLHQWQPEKK